MTIGLLREAARASCSASVGIAETVSLTGLSALAVSRAIRSNAYGACHVAHYTRRSCHVTLATLPTWKRPL